MRKAIEVAFELKNGGHESLGMWLARQKSSGASLRAIADALSVNVGVPVSHEAVRQWLKAG